MRLSVFPSPPTATSYSHGDGDGTADFLSDYQWWDIAAVMTTETYYENPDTMAPNAPRVHCFRSMFGHKQPSNLVAGGTDQLYLGLMFPVPSWSVT